MGHCKTHEESDEPCVTWLEGKVSPDQQSQRGKHHYKNGLFKSLDFRENETSVEVASYEAYKKIN